MHRVEGEHERRQGRAAAEPPAQDAEEEGGQGVQGQAGAVEAGRSAGAQPVVAPAPPGVGGWFFCVWGGEGRRKERGKV